MLEVLPALGTEFGTHTVLIHQDDVLITGNVTDLRDGNACNSGGETLATACGEKQFVVVAAMQRELQLDIAGWFPDAGPGDGRGVDLRADAALFADVPEIRGQAVAEIDHGRGESFFKQEPAYFDAGGGVEVAGKIGRSQFPAGE
jgi:hypothetical protein